MLPEYLHLQEILRNNRKSILFGRSNMYNFQNDYSEGAHPDILKKLLETNDVQQIGYGEDNYSLEAKELLKQKINNLKASIYFVSGGTQANFLVISSLLRIHEAVISARTGHIYANEAGAIEATGHRVIAVETEDGKLTPSHVEQVMNEYTKRPHVLAPRMVYISNSTEVGTIYTKSELEKLSEYCKKKELYLFLDGARLGNALIAKDGDLSLSDISQLTDVFYIGGTKNGALLGEAIVFNEPNLASNFDYAVKQKGAMLAKGRLLGIQFLELFKNNLYFDLAVHANETAMKIAKAIKEKGYSFVNPPVSNQIFPILPKIIVDELAKKYLFHQWGNSDEEYLTIRLVTSWATENNIIEEFIRDFNLQNDRLK